MMKAQNNRFVDIIQSGGYLSAPLKHDELHRMLKKYASSIKELDSLKLVLNKAINVLSMRNWISQIPERIANLSTSTNPSILLNLAMNDNELISKLANRIYYYRCSIAHAKVDVDEYIAIPEISNKAISNEIPLIRWVAENTIKHCSNW